MKINTAQEYKDSLRALKHKVYVFGKQVEDIVNHPIIQPHINAAAMTYELANRPETQDLVTAISHLTGERISRFTHIHQNTQDLVKKVKMLRLLGQQTGTCFQRCVGMDALNSLYCTTYEMDEKFKTGYHKKFRDYLTYIQSNNFMCCGAMTDPKGDRSLSPSQQPDPDQYVRVVKREKDGIIIRGAKIHQTGGVNSHEIIIMPTTALKEEDKDYAVACAVPVNSPGITFIFGRQSNDSRKMESGEIDKGNAEFGIVGGEATIVFEDVFIPWDRVFMCGEFEFAGQLVEMFASYHRQNYGGCKGGVSDVVVGAAATIAEYQGIAKASHVRDKITEMLHLTETLYSCSIACSAEGQPTPSGAYYVSPMLANIAKHNTTRHIYEICRLCHDIAGGFIATMPSEEDLRSPEVGALVKKYFSSVAQIPTEFRLRIGRLIENMTSGTALVESMHGAGSPQAQRVMIYRQGNLKHKMQLAQKLAGIKKIGNQ